MPRPVIVLGAVVSSVVLALLAISAHHAQSDVKSSNLTRNTSTKPLVQANGGILTVEAADKILAAGGGPIMRLTAPGKNPRRDLHYSLVVNKTSQFELDMDMTMTLTVPGRPPSAAASPQFNIRMVTTVDKTADDKFQISGKFTKVALSPKDPEQEKLSAQLRPEIEKLKDLEMIFWLTRKGYVNDVHVALPPGLSSDLQQRSRQAQNTFTSMTPLFPSEEIGSGAEWQVTTRGSQGALEYLQFTTYTLKESEGTHNKVEVSIAQYAIGDLKPQTDLPPNTTLHLKSFDSHGGGIIQIDTGMPVPVAGSMLVHATMDMLVTSGDARQLQTIAVDTIARLRSTPK